MRRSHIFQMALFYNFAHLIWLDALTL